jgi:single-strand DNA-binding protein
MASLNKVLLMGNLTRDPETRFTPSGTAVGDLGLAVNRRFRGTDGQDREETCFVRVTVWGRQAETGGEYLRKGSPVLVEGRLKLDEWEKDGQKQSRLGVVAERVQFIGAPRGAEYRDHAGDDERPGPQAGPSRRPDREEPDPTDLGGDEDNLPF